MNLTVTGHHVDVTSSMRNYVTDKMSRLQRHSDNLFGIHVILTVEKLRQKAEATIDIAGTRIYADETREDMYSAIDLLTDKLDRQLIRHKEKLKSRRHDREPVPPPDEGVPESGLPEAMHAEESGGLDVGADEGDSGNGMTAQG